jgi:hypothetical protein
MHPYDGRAANVAHVVVGRGVLVLATRGGDLTTRDTDSVLSTSTRAHAHLKLKRSKALRTHTIHVLAGAARGRTL